MRQLARHRGFDVDRVGAPSVDGRPLLSRLSIRGGIDLVDRLTNALQHEVELVVRDVEVLQNRLERGRGLDVVAHGQQ
ncbi:MAG: hypothetical protein M3153_07735 [Chloroflexota bacterium]|nr:hypothetical protein [Chloroflexota bacterium]